ncbi:MAG TPA: DoxX family protein [Stellaceae bacterium]|nr:DoxX family protein [Stellaceae bacterium]
MSADQIWAPRVLSIVRIVVGLLFLQHGLSKWFGFPAPYHHLTPLLGVAGIIEIAGPVLVILGLFTRPAAFIMSGEMAIAYFMAHLPKSPFPLVNGGDPAILFCFIFLYLFVAGGGAWSLDRLFLPRSARRATI